MAFLGLQLFLAPGSATGSGGTYLSFHPVWFVHGEREWMARKANQI
jgi:hypothetical protein